MEKDTKDHLSKEGLEEIILVDRQLSHTDYEVLTEALKVFNHLPVGTKSRKMAMAIKKQKETARDLLRALGAEFTRLLAVTNSELSIIKKSLSYFAYLQVPMNATIDKIKNFKNQQNVALNLLEEL